MDPSYIMGFPHTYTNYPLMSILLEWVFKFYHIICEKHIILTEKDKNYEINCILLKIQHYAECYQNTANFLIALYTGCIFRGVFLYECTFGNTGI
jgi:hypothetical protein